MTTVTGVLQPPTGTQAVTLTSWAGDAVFPITPAAGMQLAGADTLTIGVDGVVTGADGSYSLTLINGASTGTAYSVAYTVSTAASPSGVTVTGTLQAPAGWQVITLPTGYNNTIFTQEGIAFEFEATDKTGWQFGIEAAPSDVELTLSGTDVVLSIPGVSDGSGGLTRPTGIDTLPAVLVNPASTGTAHGIQVDTTNIPLYGETSTATRTGNVNDDLMASLSAYTGTINDRIYKSMAAKGRTGTFSDRMRQEGGWKAFVKSLLP